MSAAICTPQTSRAIFVWCRVAGFVGLLIWQCVRLTNPAMLGVTDFVEYWCAARLNVADGNPYSPADMQPLQRAAGWDKDEPMMMQNPPWTLSILLPFAALDFQTAQVLWLLFHLGLVFVSVELAWRFYGGVPERRWLYWLIGLSFFPALIVLRMGQIVPLMVVGLLGFMYFERARRDWLAGAMLALVSIKPHLVFLVWPAILVWSISRGRWAILAGAVIATIVALAIPSCWNPQLLPQYIDALLHRPPTDLVAYPTPTLGTVLWFAVGKEHAWIRLLPTLAAVAWLAYYMARRWQRWDWSLQLPILILVSVLTAFYTWPFDMVLFLIPLMQTAVLLVNGAARKPAWLALGLHMAISAIAVVMALAEFHSFWFLWIAPLFVGAYFALQRAGSAATECRVGPILHPLQTARAQD
jgi:hypothetical protein